MPSSIDIVNAFLRATVTLEMAEWFRLPDGRIGEHRSYYDPREFATAFRLAA